MALTKTQLEKEVAATVEELEELLAMPEVKDLLGNVEIATRPCGTESGDVLYLTPNGIVHYHWNREIDMFDQSSIAGSGHSVNREEFLNIVKGFGLKIGLLKDLQRRLRE